MTPFHRPIRSILGQMILLCAVFAGVGLYLRVVRPLLDAPAIRSPDPVEWTVSHAAAVVQGALRQGGDAVTLSARIEAEPSIQQLYGRNPGFRYFAMNGDVRVGTAAPRYLEASGIARMIAARRLARAGHLCVRAQETVHGPRGLDHLDFDDCGTPRYVELRGIAAPIDVPVARPAQALAARAWSLARGFLLPALGVLAICTAIMVIHIVRIRRIARLVQPVEEGEARQLDEGGLPSEILPLIRAVNRMIAAGAAGERRRRFFLSAAAHEMRTPLAVLRTRLELLDDSEDRTKLIADVRRLSRVVNDLLTLARIRERPVEFVDTNLSAVGRQAVEGLDPVAMRQGVTLRVEGPRDAVVPGDERLIGIAVTNLVDNAIAATPPGGSVWITVARSGWLSVRDNGTGIAADRLPEIFEPFVRFSDRPSGHGLGLAIVRAVVDAHHATIEVASEEGRGTTFTIRFAGARGTGSRQSSVRHRFGGWAREGGTGGDGTRI